MIEKEFICIICPNSCSIKVRYEDGNSPKLISAEGSGCTRGKAWVQQEIENPMRTFSSSVLVDNGDFIEASVRLTKPVPLTKIFDVMEAIKKVRLQAPLLIGDVILSDPAGTVTDVIVTRNVSLKTK